MCKRFVLASIVAKPKRGWPFRGFSIPVCASVRPSAQPFVVFYCANLMVLQSSGSGVLRIGFWGIGGLVDWEIWGFRDWGLGNRRITGMKDETFL